jgi:hypothetical protein
LIHKASAFIVGLASMTACGGGGEPAPPVQLPNCDPNVEFCDPIPLSANACTDRQYWPFIARSGIRPVNVHYSRIIDEPKAREMLGILEESWMTQVDLLGFTAPLDDGGSCGPDGRYDVFIWRGIQGAYVDAIAENPQTLHDDYLTYMVISIAGSTGTSLLDTTLAHEFNHSVQASDDWWESAHFFEMSATFVEALVYPQEDDYFFTLEDFQARPEWSLFRDDNYATWYMYGAAMYLHFLRERYYPNDSAFIARVWRASRSTPTGNRPDFIDAFRAVLLADRGITLDETIIEFNQWRWFVDEFDDGAHFSRGADWAFPVAFTDVDATAVPITLNLSAMMFGANFFRLTNVTTSPISLNIDLIEDDPDVDWNVSTVSGDNVAAMVTIPAQSSTVLVATAMPVNEVHSGTIAFDLRDGELTLSAP